MRETMQYSKLYREATGLHPDKLFIYPCFTSLEEMMHTGVKNYPGNFDGIVSTFSIKVRVTERIRWDSVYMVHGFGQPEYINNYVRQGQYPNERPSAFSTTSLKVCTLLTAGGLYL